MDAHINSPCECEHESHFDSRGLHQPLLRPPTAHKYGATFAPDQITPVKTIMGTFKVCPTCASTCYGPDSGVRKP